MEKTDSSPLSRQALYADKKQWNQFLSPDRSYIPDRHAFRCLRTNLPNGSRCLRSFPGMDSLHYSLGGCYPFRSVMADVHRITLYYDMVVQYTDCQCQLLGNDFAGQCSNLDMCLNNDHHGMDECKRSLGQKQSLVCQLSLIHI